jgi:hypothetical protein
LKDVVHGVTSQSHDWHQRWVFHTESPNGPLSGHVCPTEGAATRSVWLRTGVSYPARSHPARGGGVLALQPSPISIPHVLKEQVDRARISSVHWERLISCIRLAGCLDCHMARPICHRFSLRARSPIEKQLFRVRASSAQTG